MAGHRLRVFAQAIVQFIRAPGQCASDAANGLIGRAGQQVILTVFEQLRECILQQRQRAALLPDVGDDRGDQCRLQGQSHTLGRAANGALQFLRAHGQDNFCTLTHQFAKSGVKEGAIIEVCTQRDHQAQTTVWFFQGQPQAVQETGR